MKDDRQVSSSFRLTFYWDGAGDTVIPRIILASLISVEL